MSKTSPEGDRSANGLAEIGMRESKARVRVLRSQLESNLKSELKEDDPVVAWISRHAANKLLKSVLHNGRRTRLNKDVLENSGREG